MLFLASRLPIFCDCQFGLKKGICKMNRQTPIEVRKALGIRMRTKLAEIPADMRMPIPKAEWADDPKLFN